MVRMLSQAALVASLLVTPSLVAQGLPGEVIDKVKISETQGGLGVDLPDGAFFGSALAWLGDLDGDGVGELAVGVPGVAAGPSPASRGAVYVLFLNSDGSLRRLQIIGPDQGGFLGHLDPLDYFGASLASLGDLDGDGVPDLAVGAFGNSGGPESSGAVWILFLRPDGTVKSHRKINAAQGGFVEPPGGLLFGWSLATLGDLDGDGVTDLAMGDSFDHDGSEVTGAVWILFLRADGTVKAQRKIGVLEAGLQGKLGNAGAFGVSVASLGDSLDPGFVTLAVGAHEGTDFSEAPGAVWLLQLKPDGSVHRHRKIDADALGENSLGSFDAFGVALAPLGDLDGDGYPDLAVGASLDSDGPNNFWRGAVWLLFLGPGPSVRRVQKISKTSGNFGHVPKDARFGDALVRLPDFDGNGVANLAVGMPGDKDGGTQFVGSLWMLNLRGAVWTELGHGLPGVGGTPELTGQGSLVAGQETVLRLEGAAPMSASILFAGTTRIDAPLLGGVLVPSPDGLAFVTTDGTGSATIQTRWPAGLPTETSVYFQAWIADPTAPQGYAASLALEATTP